ncbi:hypothetical protein PR048_026145 [Dryococelus australis]|uniref:Uncharacterized protein n=1 Tax=Dryococelus australis TaxID=614101 RepID=A0ABQ9GKI8_9NEOP|nr:hypothetical protein PR048_026145 [Dryococelus australis]
MQTPTYSNTRGITMRMLCEVGFARRGGDFLRSDHSSASGVNLSLDSVNKNTIKMLLIGGSCLPEGGSCHPRREGDVALASNQGEPGSIPDGMAPGFSHVGIVLDDVCRRRVLSVISRFPRPRIPALLHIHLAPPSLAPKTPMFRAARNPTSATTKKLPAPKCTKSNGNIVSKHEQRLTPGAFGKRGGRCHWPVGFLWVLPFPPTTAFRCCFARRLWEPPPGAGVYDREKLEFPEKTRRQAASSSTIPSCGNPGADPPGIGPGSPWWEASALATAPSLPQFILPLPQNTVWHVTPSCSKGWSRQVYLFLPFITCHCLPWAGVPSPPPFCSPAFEGRRHFQPLSPAHPTPIPLFPELSAYSPGRLLYRPCYNEPIVCNAVLTAVPIPPGSPAQHCTPALMSMSRGPITIDEVDRSRWLRATNLHVPTFNFFSTNTSSEYGVVWILATGTANSCCAIGRPVPAFYEQRLYFYYLMLATVVSSDSTCDVTSGDRYAQVCTPGKFGHSFSHIVHLYPRVQSPSGWSRLAAPYALGEKSSHFGSIVVVSLPQLDVPGRIGADIMDRCVYLRLVINLHWEVFYVGILFPVVPLVLETDASGVNGAILRATSPTFPSPVAARRRLAKGQALRSPVIFTRGGNSSLHPQEPETEFVGFKIFRIPQQLRASRKKGPCFASDHFGRFRFEPYKDIISGAVAIHIIHKVMFAKQELHPHRPKLESQCPDESDDIPDTMKFE